jgi:pilus assembly protein CpaB
MRSKTLILMMVAIVCGLAASYMTSKLIDQKKEGEDEQVGYLVAKQKIEMGTLIKEPDKLFELKTVRKGDEPKNAVKTFEEIKDHRLNKQLSADYHVTADDLLDKSTDSMTSNIQKGMRGFAIKTTIDSGVAGFVLPHSRVDIIASMREKSGKTVSKTLWQNVLVMAVDTMQSRPDDKNAFVGSTVTVEVTPAMAEEMDSVVVNGGTLRLTLRGFQDEEKVTTRGANVESLSQQGSQRPEDVASKEDEPGRKPVPSFIPLIPDVPAVTVAPPPQPQPQPVVAKEEPKPASFTMTIFNGESQSKHVFQEGAPVVVEKSQPDAPAKAKPAQVPARGNGSK